MYRNLYLVGCKAVVVMWSRKYLARLRDSRGDGAGRLQLQHNKKKCPKTPPHDDSLPAGSGEPVALATTPILASALLRTGVMSVGSLWRSAISPYWPFPSTYTSPSGSSYGGDRWFCLVLGHFTELKKAIQNKNTCIYIYLFEKCL